MVRCNKEAKYSEKKMFDGAGMARMRLILESNAEMYDKGRVFNHLYLDPDEIERRVYSRYGPYVENDIVVAVRANSYTMNKMMLTGKKMVMPSTPEAMAALNTDPKLIKRLGQITRLAGGTTECFAQLYAGKCDAVLTDSTALYYFNSH